MALGSETGSRLAARLSTPVSPADPLRLVRRLSALVSSLRSGRSNLDSGPLGE
jgi:hypothetical protein